MALASNGWQYQTRQGAAAHAEHIHSNCDCTYAVRFDRNLEVAGYDPEEYRKIYYDAEGKSGKDKINSMRRMLYAKNKSIVGAESSKAEELIPSVLNKFGKKISFERPQTDNARVQELRNRQEAIYDLTSSVKSIAQDMSYIKEDVGEVKAKQTELNDKVTVLENRPANETKKRWDSISMELLKLFVVGVVSFLLAQVLPPIF